MRGSTAAHEKRFALGISTERVWPAPGSRAQAAEVLVGPAWGSLRCLDASPREVRCADLEIIHSELRAKDVERLEKHIESILAQEKR